MTEELKKKILEQTPAYPYDNNSKEKEAGYHEATKDFIKVFDKLIAEQK